MAAWWSSYITKRSRQLGLDPQAVLAVASREGLSGAVGDRGTSFGPFQLHVGGALPRGRGRAWAESTAGIDYALQKIAGVARGQHGQQAISSIVSRFERPADPRSEIQGALAAYGKGGGGPLALSSATSAGQAPAGPDLSSLRLGLVQSLVQASQESGQHRTPDYSGVFSAIQALQKGRQQGASVGSPVAASTQPAQGGGPSRGGPSLSFLTPLAKQFGLTITSTNKGNHVEGSYHYQNRAEDYGGNAAHMAGLQRYALAHPGQFVEVFYTGPGAAPYFVKNGKVHPISQLDQSVRDHHHDHVHLAR